MTGTVSVKQFLEQLNRAMAEGRAKIEIDFNRMSQANCPLGYQAFRGRIAYIYLGLMAAMIGGSRWAFKLEWSMVVAAAVAFSAVYWIFVKGRLEARAVRKIVSQITTDSDAWEKIWPFGGVTLKVTSGGAEAVWNAPKDRWKDAYEQLLG
ncbi:MAG: hypothetical protein FJX54_08210 [Alphaproteobacteria bacterium]|nr:hypothetical protein [Alphaproteobacteria bacterium]